MAYGILLLSLIAAAGATYPPNQQPPAPAAPSTSGQAYSSNAQSPPASAQQNQPPPIRAPVIAVYQTPQMQGSRMPNAHHGGGSSAGSGRHSASRGGGGGGGSGGAKLKEILYILPIIQSIDRITDDASAQTSGRSQHAGPSRTRPSSGSQQQPTGGYSSQTMPASGAGVQMGYGQAGSAGQTTGYGTAFSSMMTSSQSASSGYGSSNAQAPSPIQLPLSYGQSSGQSQSSGYQSTSSGYGTQQQQQQQPQQYHQQQQQMQPSGYSSSIDSLSSTNRMIMGRGRQMASSYGSVQMLPPSSSSSVIEVGVALKPVISQQNQYPMLTYSQLNNDPKGQQAEVYLTDTPMQGYGDQMMVDDYGSQPTAYELCEQGFNLDGFCKGKYAGLYSHPNPQCFIQCDQFETHTTSLCAPGTIWLSTDYEPSSVNQCMHSSNGISGAH